MEPHSRERLLRERYPSVAYDLLRPLVELLSVARQICGGDLDKFLIALVVEVRSAGHPAFKNLSQDDLLTGKTLVLPSLGANVRSIADSVGMPKETARRKLAELHEAGWFVRTGRDIRFAASGYRDVAPARERIEALALGYATLIETLVTRGQP